MSVRDYTPLLEKAIAEAKAAGLATEANELDSACFRVAFTTSNELLHEHGIAIRNFLKATDRRLPPATREKLEACLTEIDLVWPGWRKLRALFRRRVPKA